MEHPIIVGSDGKIINTNAPIKMIGNIAKYLQSNHGKSQLAAAMAAPIRRNLDYQGIARRALKIDPLPQGALPTYDRDIDVASVISSDEEKVTKFEHDRIFVGSNGKLSKYRSAGRVVVPSFEVYQNPTIRIGDVKQRRFSLIDRAVQKARQQIMEQEDADIFAAMDAKSSGNKEE